ncbi:LTA synthase family protein [Streptococcus sp. ZJ93]|uniref:LTA synthase family protein n=1 Tax=Streptococcus handemini TaxID=3161188 RepID=UPI0032EC00C7
MKRYFEKNKWLDFLEGVLICGFGLALNWQIFFKIYSPIIAWSIYAIGIVGFVYCVSCAFRKSLLLKLVLGYITYIIISYFILTTRNLNNGQFDVWDFSTNHLWELSSIPTLLGIMILGTVLYLLYDKISILDKIKRRELNSKENVLVALLLSVCILSDSKLTSFLWGSPNDIDSYMFLAQNAIIWLECTVLTYIVFDSFDAIGKNKPTLSLACTTSLLLAVVFNYTLQIGVKEEAELLGRYVFPGATLYQILVLFLLFLFTYLLINRFISATLLLLSSGILFSIVNMLKESMRSEPLLVTDFVWLQDVGLLMSFITQETLLMMVVIILLPILIWWFCKDKVMRGPILVNKKIQASMLLIISTIFVGVFIAFSNEENGKIQHNIPIITTLNNWYDINWMGFATNARYKSLMYVWTKQLTTDIMDQPQDYSQERIDYIAKKYTDLAKDLNQERTESIANQTVIYVLSESLSNPNRVEGVQLTKDILENIDNIKSQTTSGLMRSDGYGGGTANMEFQTLTGLPFYNFSSSVSAIYTEVVPKMSVLPSISDLYESDSRLVLHPSGANNYGRKNVYRRLGFSKLIFATDSDNTFSSVMKKGVSISDKTVYDNVLKELDSSKNQFFSVITMQNHAPWSVGEPVDVVAYNDSFTKEENGALTEYARLASYTDHDTKEFLDKLSQIDKRITVVFYGDHLPGLYPSAAFKDNPDSQYQTDYFIWSNYNTQHTLNYPLVNSSDFTAELLEHTNSKVSPYYALLTQVLQKASIDKDHFDSDQKEIADDLKLLQYDITLGKNYISKHLDFFKVGE